MEEGRPTDRMHELIEQIRKALDDLDHGQLDLDGVDRTTDQARSLYERLVVLRHKAREVKVIPPPAPAVETPPPPPPPVEMPTMRLDTRPSEAPPRQTSLIDAIAETETTPAPPPAPPPAAPRAEKPAEPASPKKAPEAPKTAPKAASLADKLEKGPVADLHKAIALSQKFWFVAELFQGQRERYERSIDDLNSLASAEEARAYVIKEIVAPLGKAPDADALKSFLELVERRYP